MPRAINTKSPACKKPGGFSKSSKTSEPSDCFSITIRTGKGIVLGDNSFSRIIDYLKSISRYYVLALEMDDDDRHLQGGIFLKKEMRQDNLRATLLPMVLDMWECQMIERNELPTSKARKNVQKAALCVKEHDNWTKLVQYCLKDPDYYIGHNSPVDLIEAGIGCKHYDIKSRCKIYWRKGECVQK